jgi:hypothetical protein
MDSDLVKIPTDRAELLIVALDSFRERRPSPSLLDAACVEDEVVGEQAHVGV